MREEKYINKDKDQIHQQNESVKQAHNYQDKLDPKKSRVHRDMYYKLASKCLFGVSRDEMKKRAIEDGKEIARSEGRSFNLMKDARLDGIYSLRTYESYQEIANRYADDMQAQGIHRASKESAEEWLESKAKEGLKEQTVKTYRSALNKVYGGDIEIEIPKTDKRDRDAITERSRHFSEKNNERLVEVARSTGMRRSELERLSYRDFVRNPSTGRYDRVITRGKGGKTRVINIAPQNQPKITNILKQRYHETAIPTIYDKERLFPEGVHTAANIHAYRRDYAREMYATLCRDKEYAKIVDRNIQRYDKDVARTLAPRITELRERERLLEGRVHDPDNNAQRQPTRLEQEKSPIRAEIERLEKIPQPIRYGQRNKDPNIPYRTNQGEVYHRGNVWLVSQSLGHNRIDTSIVSYLRY